MWTIQVCDECNTVAVRDRGDAGYRVLTEDQLLCFDEATRRALADRMRKTLPSLAQILGGVA